MKPIEQLAMGRRMSTYWITATFTGDEFLPRVV
jgi:hypothetical protein